MSSYENDTLRAIITRAGVKRAGRRVWLVCAGVVIMASIGISQIAPADVSGGVKLEIQVVGGFGGECLRAGASGVCLFSIKGTRQMYLPGLVLYGKGASERNPPCLSYSKERDGEFNKYQCARIHYEFYDVTNAIASSGDVCVDGGIVVDPNHQNVYVIPVVAPKASGRYGFSITFDNEAVRDASMSYNTFIGNGECFARSSSDRVDVSIE